MPQIIHISYVVFVLAHDHEPFGLVLLDNSSHKIMKKEPSVKYSDFFYFFVFSASKFAIFDLKPRTNSYKGCFHSALLKRRGH
jgi:hypothetical protein